MVRTRGRKGAAKPDDIVAQARHLVETTALSQADIADRLGMSRPTLIHWRQAGGWSRPPGAPAPYGGPQPSAGGRERAEAGRDALARLAEAERLLGEIERDGTAGLDRIAAALGELDGPIAALRRKRARAARHPAPCGRADFSAS